MHTYILKKEDFDRFIAQTKENYEFIAPVKEKKEKQSSRSYFKSVDSLADIYLDKKSYHSVKSYFFSPGEVLFEFHENEIINPAIVLNDKVFFGLRKCDLNGIMHQDIVFLDENVDPFYKIRREHSVLIGLHCKTGDEYCFCNSFELVDYFDLMFYDKQDHYIIEVGSKKGEEFVTKFPGLISPSDNILTPEDKKIENSKRLNTIEIQNHYNSQDWKKGSDKCLACGACNMLCMNCHCFEIVDDVHMNLKDGKRVRNPASCQLRHFTRVAGDHIFRNEKLARFKHRIYHQIQYFKDRHKVVFCTGCGRCIEGCPAKIDWVEIINELK